MLICCMRGEKMGFSKQAKVPNGRFDNMQRKRVELHLHSNMSAFDGLMSADAVVAQTAAWGQSAVAITDHGTVQAYPGFYQVAKKAGIKAIFGMEGYLLDEFGNSFHIVLLVKNAEGLFNMYRIVTASYLEHYHRRPQIPRALLSQYREGLLLGSACEAGELYQAILRGENKETLNRIASFYDYLEVQPRGNNAFLLREGKIDGEDALRAMNCRVIDIAESLGKPCVATTDAHFQNPSDSKYRAVMMGVRGFADADDQAPLYMRTTEEMLAEFSYLPKAVAERVVITEPNRIAAQCEMLPPFPMETCQPTLPGAKEKLHIAVYKSAETQYGKPLPAIVRERLAREMGAIEKYGFSTLYVVAMELVKKSNADGYLVGSRGSVGSSLAAYFAGITEINALAPHYFCPQCKHSDFAVDSSVFHCGWDLPAKSCPACGAQMCRDGFDIPFETFLGVEGDKVPDIDLNFSGEYQPKAHAFIRNLFGENNVFRAGTITAMQEKTACGYLIEYAQQHGRRLSYDEAKTEAHGLVGVKQTVGQHPGGFVILPKGRSIFEFTPLQHPVNDTSVITTHFDFKSMHDTLIKLDLLGHDDPTMIRRLQALTKVDPYEIPLDDPQVLQLFSSTASLGLKASDLLSRVGTYGIPEFGTPFVRAMLEKTGPSSLEELIRIAGLAHGTNVWLGNAEELIKNGTVTLRQAISTRDDIMMYLISHGMEKKQAFSIMEYVRKGKAVKNGMPEEMGNALRAAKIPRWYIESCKKIQYMYPRAHAAAYVMMSFRIAYFKLHYPLAYYAAYFSIRAPEFKASFADMDIRSIQKRLRALPRGASPKKEHEGIMLELVLEMKLRGFTFARIDLMRSDAVDFTITENNRLLIPLRTLPGMGEKAARSIAEARAVAPFRTQEELLLRTSIGQAGLSALKESGCLKDIPEQSQLSMFD